MTKRDKRPAKYVKKGVARAFFEEAIKTDNRIDCIEWPFDKVTGGYGRICILGKKYLVHRLSCEAANGKPPTVKHEAAHWCANRACINPHHVRWATKLENAADRILHGNARGVRGEANPASKLTEEQVFAIKRQIPFRLQREIAADFGVSQVLISRIKLGKAWIDE